MTDKEKGFLNGYLSDLVLQCHNDRQVSKRLKKRHLKKNGQWSKSKQQRSLLLTPRMGQAPKTLDSKFSNFEKDVV